MATGTADGARSEPPPNRGQRRAPVGVVEYGRYIERQLNRTSSQVKGTDLFGGFLTMAAGALAFLFAAVLVDHWVVPEGLGSWSRLLSFLMFLGGIAAYFVLAVLPPFVRRINPVYAAQTIEKGQPALKNSLINLLLLRPNRAGMPAPVFDAIEEQAATSLARTPVESSVDRSRIIRIGLILLGVVVACALYVVFSPKDPLKSAARVLIPWADIERPTRITIDNIAVEVVETGKTISGGNATVTLGQHVKITASVSNRGVLAQESALVRFSSLKGREIVDQQLSMQQGEYGQYLILPAADNGSSSEWRQGLQQGIEYSIRAGDTVRGPFQIEVVAAPIIEVTKLEYQFPAYTRLPDRQVSGTGDVRALEGTTVTVHARANQEIRAAYIDFHCDGHSDRAMQVSGQQASISFVLRLREDRRTPTYDCYLLRFTNHDGHENRQPVRYRIAVTPDLPPEIEFVAPREPEERDELAVGGILPMAVRATDRDFDLAGVMLRAELQAGSSSLDGKQLKQTLLDELRIDQFRSEPFGFVPARHGFEAGDTIVYWAEARDNRHPEANLVETPRYTLRIVAPPDNERESNPEGNAQRQPDAEQDDAGGRDQRDKPRQDDPNATEQSDPEASENGDDQSAQPQGVGGGDDDAGGKQQKGDAEGGTATEPDAGDTRDAEDQGVDPDSQDGDAFERIIEHLEKQQKAAGGQNDGGQENQEADQDGTEEPVPDSSTGAGSPTERRNPQDSDGGSEAAEGTDDNSHPGQGDENKPSSGGEADGQSEPSSAADDQHSDARQPADSETDPDSDRQAADSDNADGTPGQSPDPSDNNLPSQEKNASADDRREPDSDAKQEGSQTGASDQQKGPAGDGGRTKDDTRSPDPQGSNKPRDKQADSPEAATDGTKQPADSPSISKHESDTEGSESGDRSGEGEEGGGQPANQDGSGAAGQNRPADQGADAAQQPGEGETSNRPGDKTPSEQSAEDSSSQTPGKGDNSRPGDRDTGSGQDRNDRPPGDQQRTDPSDPKEQRKPNDGSGRQSTQQPRSDDNSGQSGSPGEGTSSGDDLPGQRRDAAASDNKPAARGADPNLEYAKKATDLALEKLKDQLSKDQADQELLDKLKWTREDLERFVERWEKMKQAAGAPGPEGQKADEELDAALRGLGLRRQATSIQGGGRTKDPLRGVRQSGRSEPPGEYSELYRQYTTGTSKGLPSQRK